MPAGIYDISKGTYTLRARCTLNKILKDSNIISVVGPLGTLTPTSSGTPVPYVDPQGWPIPPSVSAPAQKWHLSEGDLLNIAASVTGLSGLAPATHRWVANITPKRKHKSSGIGIAFLAEIKKVWGYRYLGWTATGCWTPIMVKFKVLWLDYLGTTGLPSSFPVPPKPWRSFFEFFYITNEGKLNTGPYSQPALFPDALEYFVGEMRKSLLRPPDKCGEGKDIICP